MAQVKLAEFESIGEYYSKKFKKALNIETVDEFYSLSFKEIQNKMEIDEKRLQQFADVLDLFRIPKLTSRDAELLYYANVNSVEELSHRQATRIYYKFREIDVESYLIILQLPSFAMINEWIYFAKIMTKRIKSGLNVPLILFPMVTINNASELQKYQIWTADDFVVKSSLIGKSIRKRMDMNEEDYLALLNMIEVLKVDGIDIQLAIELAKSNFKTVDSLKGLNSEQLITMSGGLLTADEAAKIIKGGN